MQQNQQNMSQNQNNMMPGNMGNMQQSTMPGTGQNVMSQAPNVITTKDLLYLTDIMSWNLMALKKAHFYESQCQVPEISQAMQKACEMHERHYQMVLKHLENTNQPSASQSTQQQ